tara:strand:- start:8332 stop:8682 length:351 start_codon:yes stop_codon:yes gene_type:complete
LEKVVMKINYTSRSGRVSVELEAETQKDAFEQLSDFQEIFDEIACGKCASENLRFVVRNVDDNQFYEIRCSDCGARLEFGSMKKGGKLFPRRKDKDGNWLPDRGWVKWDSKKGALV